MRLQNCLLLMFVAYITNMFHQKYVQKYSLMMLALFIKSGADQRGVRGGGGRVPYSPIC